MNVIYFVLMAQEWVRGINIRRFTDITRSSLYIEIVPKLKIRESKK